MGKWLRCRVPWLCEVARHNADLVSRASPLRRAVCLAEGARQWHWFAPVGPFKRHCAAGIVHVPLLGHGRDGRHGLLQPWSCLACIHCALICKCSGWTTSAMIKAQRRRWLAFRLWLDKLRADQGHISEGLRVLLMNVMACCLVAPNDFDSYSYILRTCRLDRPA